MSTVSIATIRRRVKQLARRIDAPADLTAVRTQPSYFGDPYIEADGSLYHYLVSERGEVFEHRTTADLDELLYWVIKAITFDMATEYEVRHREPRRDFRRLLFRTDVGLMHGIKPAWAQRLQTEYDAILARSPFHDEP